MNSKELQNITMSTGGAYSLATRGAQDVINAAIPMVEEALLKMELEEKRNFSFADMGCADGGTSLQMINQLITTLRGKKPNIEVKIHYTDQPNNDYNGLIQTVFGLGHFPSYLEKHQKVYPLFSANSFYKQILPDSSLDFGFSATAMHWLSKKPCDLNHHVHMVGAKGEELAIFSEYGRRDWETILLHRSQELIPGGRMVLVNFGIDEEGRYLGNTFGVNMFETFNEIWKEFLESGRISTNEYRRMTLPQYYNTVEEFSRPLTDPANPVFQSGLRLENIRTRIVPCPFAEEFKKHGDVKRFADEYIPTIRSWNQSIFMGALDDSRPMQERQELIESYYGTYHQRILGYPEGHGMDYVHAYMTIKKI